MYEAIGVVVAKLKPAAFGMHNDQIIGDVFEAIYHKAASLDARIFDGAQVKSLVVFLVVKVESNDVELCFDTLWDLVGDCKHVDAVCSLDNLEIVRVKQ